VRTVRSISHGGSPIATEVVRRAHAAFPRAELIHLYGATELAPLATALRHEETLVDGALARSCGRAVAGVDVRIFDQGDHGLPPGEIGEVVVRGPNVMPGYWDKPEETTAALRAGWYRSGDLGFMNAQGYLFLVDRAKDMIISGGENVYSTEVEEVLYQHPAVLEAAVFGVPDAKWEKRCTRSWCPVRDTRWTRPRSSPSAVNASPATRCPSGSTGAATHCRSRGPARC
jgi:long-chain acyl-CoA synthetase